MKRFITRIGKWIWPQPVLNIKSGQSVVIIGRPGSGKSTLLRWLLRNANSVIVYDSKYDPEEWPRQTDYTVVEKVSDLGRYPRVILRCPAAWIYNQDAWDIPDHPWGLALEHPMQRQDTIAVFDEALATWPVRGGHPGTHRLIQQGRSFGVTTVVGSQLANNVDTRLLRMANHIFVMGPCKHKTELDCLFKTNHINIEPLTRLKKHQIAWWSEDADSWLVFKKLRASKNGDFLHQRKLRDFTLGCGAFLVTLVSIIGITAISLSSRPALNSFYLSLILGLLIIRAWFSRKWKVYVSSGNWEPEITEEPIIENVAKKRPPKQFSLD